VLDGSAAGPGNRSSALTRLLAAAGRAGLDAEECPAVVGAVLHELAVRMSADQWYELCCWLPTDVRSLAGARAARPVARREDLVAAVAGAAGLPRPVSAVAVRTVLGELVCIVPPPAVPARLCAGVPGL
jgi:hypothetical protein